MCVAQPGPARFTLELELEELVELEHAAAGLYRTCADLARAGDPPAIELPIGRAYSKLAAAIAAHQFETGVSS